MYYNFCFQLNDKCIENIERAPLSIEPLVSRLNVLLLPSLLQLHLSECEMDKDIVHRVREDWCMLLGKELPRKFSIFTKDNAIV